MSEKSSFRSRNYFKQLKSSFIFKVLAILASFLVIPVMIQYLGHEKYGVWSTLLSILSWIVMFDIGIGNGLRNKLSESIAKNEYIKAREYISTTYAAIACVAILVGFIFAIISEWINWSRVFNTETVSREMLAVIVNVSMFFVLINFVFATVNQILNALQKTNITVFNQFLANLFSLFFVFVLSKNTDGKLEYIAIVFGLSILFSNMLVSFWFYRRNVIYRPAIHLIKKERLFETLSLGSQFFIIQIAVIVLFTTDRLIISQLLGPEYVTPYDVVFKLFSVVTIFHGIIVAPLWNSYSDAYHRNDYTWMQGMMKRQMKILGFILLATMLLMLLIPSIIQIWIGDINNLSLNMIVSLCFFTLFQAWNNIFAMFLNGINETRLQVRTAIIAAIINIPLSILFVKCFGMGVDGIVLGSIVALGIFSVFGPYESYKKLYKVSHV